MIYIPLKENPPEKKWLNKADKVTKLLLSAPNELERHAIIDKNSQLWGEIKEHLLKLSHNKCWYSEAKESFSHYHVDHFRPKKKAVDCNGIDCGGYYWLAFEWSNYRICGSVGNTKKGDRFQVKKSKAKTQEDDLDDEIIYFLDPVDEYDPPLLTFDESGIIKPSETNEKEWSCERAKYTISNLDLNYEALKENRRTLWDDLSNRINEIMNLSKELSSAPSSAKKSKLKEKLCQLKKYAAPEHEFSAAARACLIKSGYNWAVGLI